MREVFKRGRGWHGDTPGHRRAALKGQAQNAMNTPMKSKATETKPQGNTQKFKENLSRLLSNLEKKNPDDTTIPEYRRWLKEDLMEQKALDEQIDEKIYYEKGIGNDSKVFHSITNFLGNWLTENTEQKESNLWYHGTTEEKYRKIIADGELKVSTLETIQHEGFEHDICTISLAKHKGTAHFFSAISGMGKQNQVILHIDISKLDPSAIKKRTLYATHAEILYHKNIPASAIVRAETVYVAKKNGESK